MVYLAVNLSQIFRVCVVDRVCRRPVASEDEEDKEPDKEPDESETGNSGDSDTSNGTARYR